MDILKDAFNDEASTVIGGKIKVDEYDYGKINQQLSKLHKFCGDQFRQYLLSDKYKHGLGLNSSFGDKYFLFSTQR